MTIKLELTQDEVTGIKGLLGDLPTKTNAWVLLHKIEEQEAAQIQPEAPVEDK